jgi:hypothetical protein
MRLRGLLALAVVVAALVVGLWLTRDEPDRVLRSAESVLGGRRLYDAERVVMQRSLDARAIHIVRDPAGEFRVVEPLEDVASAAFLQSLAGVYDTAQKTLWRAAAEIDARALQQTGLDPPQAIVEVRYPDATFVLELGLEGPLGQDRFMRTEGAIWLVGRALYSAIQQNPDDVREHLLFRNPIEQIRRVSLSRKLPDGKVEEVELERRGFDEFALLQPIACRADSSAAVRFFAVVGGMRLERFLDELNPMPEPDIVIEVEGGVEPLERLSIWPFEQGLIGRQEPRGVAFTIRSSDYTGLFGMPVRDLRARALVPLAAADIAEVTIKPPGEGPLVQLQRREGDQFALLQPIEAAAEPAAVNELLRATQQFEVQEFLDVGVQDLGEYGLAQGFLTVSLAARPPLRRQVTLHVGKVDGERAFVRRDDESFVGVVDAAGIAPLRLPWTSLMARSVVSLRDVNAVGAVRCAVRGSAEETLFRRQEGTWRQEKGPGDKAAFVADVVDRVCDLRAAEVIERSAVPGPDLERAAAQAITIELQRHNGEPLVALELLPVDAATSYVPHRDHPRVLFKLKPLDGKQIRDLLP